MNEVKENPTTPQPATTELLLQPDGQLLVHNLTPAMAAVLAELNPADEAMQERAAKESMSKSRITSRKTRNEPSPVSPPATGYEQPTPHP